MIEPGSHQIRNGVKHSSTFCAAAVGVACTSAGVWFLSASPQAQTVPILMQAASHVATTHDPSDPTDALEAELNRRFDTDIRPLLAAYCLDCHSGSKPKGGIGLDRLTDMRSAMPMMADLAMVRELVSTGEMPPEGEDQPSSHESLILTQWLDQALAYVPSDATIDPGWFTIHRLNRSEYRLTLRDLLGIDPRRHDLAARLPRDDTGYGLDNIADVLSVSPLTIEAYLDAAEQAIDIGLGPVIDFDAGPMLLSPLHATTNGQRLSQGGFYMYSNGAVQGTFAAPAAGEYEIRIEAWEARGGDEHARLSLRIDGREAKAFEVAGTRAEPTELVVRLRLSAGERVLAAHFTNDFYRKDVADRNMAVEWVSVQGPLDPSTTDRPALWQEIIGRHLEIAPVDAPAEDRVAHAIIAEFASKAYRRPVDEKDLAGLLGVYERSRRAGDSLEQAVRSALMAVLVSPHFLYRAIDNPHADDPQSVYALSSLELASRLSYFLWSSMPDEALMARAIDGSLVEDDVLASEVRRMIADPKSAAFVEHFAGQWLHLRSLDELAIDRTRYPDYDDDLRTAMRDEALLAFDHVLRSGRSVLSLLDDDETFLNERLALLYGIEGVRGQEMRRVQLDPDSQRGGLLTMAAVLTVTSNPTRTSPVKRGLYVLDQILGMPPPPPPADIPPLEQAAVEAAGSSVRAQLAAHVANPTCAACHNRLDPIGLAFENYDAIGRWRTHEDGQPIDATGTLPGGEFLSGVTDLKRVLLGREDQFIESLAGKVLMYAVGRGLEPFDRPAVKSIAARTRANDDRLDALIEAVVLSPTFRSARARE